MSGLLDALGLARVHLVGISMGGGIAQQVAIDHPDRVASLTLMSTNPISTSPGTPDLPPMSDRVRAVFSDPPPEPDWSDRAAVVDYLAEGERPCAGSLPSDEAHLRALAGRIVDRTVNDPDESLAFYRDALDLEVRNDVASGGFR